MSLSYPSLLLYPVRKYLEGWKNMQSVQECQGTKESEEEKVVQREISF